MKMNDKPRTFLDRVLTHCIWSMVIISIVRADGNGENEQTFYFNIPPQSLDAALRQIAEVSSTHVIYKADIVSEKRTKGFQNSYSLDQALDKSLESTGLTYRYAANNMVSVMTLAEATRNKNPIVLVDSEVSGNREGNHSLQNSQDNKSDITTYEFEEMSIIGFVREYEETSTETGLGFEADPLTVPLTTVSIPVDILADQQINNVEDALRNVAGVTRFKQGNGGEEKFSIRGFDASQSLYKDGARINNAFNATNIATTETANIERYDVLKGPAAILFGQGEPGGVINYITKKPLFESYYSAELIGGTDDFYRGEFDLTGPIGGPESSFAYRMIASYEDSKADRDEIFRERLLLAPSLTWDITEFTQLTLQYEYIDDDYTQDRGQVLDGDDETGFFYSGRQENSQFFGVPGFNEKTTSEYQRYALLFRHEFSDNAKLSINASSTRVDKTLYDSSPFPSNFLGIPGPARVIQENGDVTISPRGQGGDGESDSITVRQEFTLEQEDIAGHSIRHQFLLSGDFERIRNDGVSFLVNVPFITFNIETGVYTIPPEGVHFSGKRPGVQTDTEQYGVALQDLLSIGDHWHILLGGRYTEFDNKDAGITTDEFSPRTGLVFQPKDDLSFYFSWAKGFVPTTATGFNPATGNGIGGSPLDPEITEQFEFGTKWSLLDGGLELNAAVFDLRKQDIPAVASASLALPSDEQWSINFGETRTRGFDLQAVGQVTEALRLIGGYAYLDNELVDSGAGFEGQEGHRLGGIPENSFNLWGVYEFQSGSPLEGLGLGLGIFAQSDIFASTENRAEYDGYVQIDAVTYYKRNNWKFQLNVKNLTDEEYNLAQALTNSDTFAAIRVGTSPPLSVTASISVEF